MTNLVLAWLGRRALEIGGLLGLLFSLYTALPEGTQGAIGRLLSNNWGSVTLGDLWPLAIAAWGYIASFRATVKDQVVSGGKKVRLDDLPSSTQVLVEQKVETVVDRKKRDTGGGIEGFLKGIFGKR
jgi:hypothetical protein